MRIIAGDLGGRNFVSPSGHRTRPMSDKVRGALFNTLGDISGLSVLDAFSGSGALSFEALSRGASSATAIEIDKPAQDAITTNIKSLKLSKRIKLIKASASAWLSTTNVNYDLVLLDPPYDNIPSELITKLALRSEPNGTVVLSLPPTSRLELSIGYSLLNRKLYGDASLHFYRKLP